MQARDASLCSTRVGSAGLRPIEAEAAAAEILCY
jgi:hypothetical protein